VKSANKEPLRSGRGFAAALFHEGHAQKPCRGLASLPRPSSAHSHQANSGRACALVASKSIAGKCQSRYVSFLSI
jgi:hypothetical protein